MALLDRVMSFGDRKEGFFAKQRHGSDPNKGIEARENFDNHERAHFLKEMPFSRSCFCLIRQAKAWNDDFDRGKSEQLKTKRIGRSRIITSLSRCTGNRLHTTPPGRDQGWCTKSEHLQIFRRNKM